MNESQVPSQPLAAVIDQCPKCGSRTRELRSSPIRVTTNQDGERQEQEVPEHRIGWHCTACPWFWTKSLEDLEAAEKRSKRKPLAGLAQAMAEDRRRGKRGGSSGVKGRRPQKPGDREGAELARARRYEEMVADGMGGRVLGQPERVDLLGLFLAECLVREDGARLPFAQLYAAFKLWAEASGVSVWSERVLSRQVSERGYSRVSVHRGRSAFLGLRLKRRGI